VFACIVKRSANWFPLAPRTTQLILNMQETTRHLLKRKRRGKRHSLPFNSPWLLLLHIFISIQLEMHTFKVYVDSSQAAGTAHSFCETLNLKSAAASVCKRISNFVRRTLCDAKLDPLLSGNRQGGAPNCLCKFASYCNFAVKKFRANAV